MCARAVARSPATGPWPKLPEHAPRVLSAEAQDAILSAIPDVDRGIFLALAGMGLRPSEAVASFSCGAFGCVTALIYGLF